ncbi:MAG TPA: TetR/AcrR family transcriptional regulator [Solirubrobacterales bacterium]|nr:TetR/AcrR family transcriptional regulator [Solirubrobacterales bacterium]
MEQWVERDANLALARGMSVAAETVEEREIFYDKLSPGPGLPTAEVAAHQCARIHGALVTLVGARGYGAVKVRDVVRLAGVSTRAFYEHFDSKADCFLRTHELVVRGAVRRIVAAQADEPDWRERLRLMLNAFVREVGSGPDAARLALIDAYEAGTSALEQAWRTERTLETMIGESFGRGPDGIPVPPLIVEGIVAGVARVARRRLLAGRSGEVTGLGDELGEWALCFPGKASGELAILDRRSVGAGRTADLSPTPASLENSNGSGQGWPPQSDRGIILAAVAKLAAARGYRHLTIPRIRARAGISRAAFDVHFKSVDECFLAALEFRAGDALAEAARAQSSAHTWAGGVYRAVVALCDRIGSDPLLVGLCLDDYFLPGTDGSLWRKSLIAVAADQIRAGVPPEHRLGGLPEEASKGAIWALLHHHVVRNPAPQGPQIAATLAYLALAPVIGAPEAVAAIRCEQTA